MCYSALVKQEAKEIGMTFYARVQLDLFESLFERRLVGEKIYLNKAIEQQFFNGATPQETRIRNSIIKWHSSEVFRLEQELFAQKKRLADAERVLNGRPTKRAEDDKRIATNKIKKCLAAIEGPRNLEKMSETDQRIFPGHYMSALILNEKGERIVAPLRYLMRPNNKDANFDVKFNGCYNARLDNLENVAWWRDSLEKRRGVIFVKRFYENVAVADYIKKNALPKEIKERENIVISFAPDDGATMAIPILWDKWQRDGAPTLYSAALITDDPPPEVSAAGHDRCPIFLKESAVGEWLENATLENYIDVLAKRELPRYSHKVLLAG